jgi:hypothetical protein
VKEVALAHACDLFAKKMDSSRIRAQQSIGQLKQDALADARGAKKDSGFSRGHGETYILENGRTVKGDHNVLKLEDGAWLEGRSAAASPKGNGSDGVCHQPKKVSITWVRRKSTKIISTDETTTA